MSQHIDYLRSLRTRSEALMKVEMQDLRVDSAQRYLAECDALSVAIKALEAAPPQSESDKVFDVWRARHPFGEESQDDRMDVSADVTNTLLLELGFKPDEFEDSRMDNLRTTILTMVELLEFGE